MEDDIMSRVLHHVAMLYQQSEKSPVKGWFKELASEEPLCQKNRVIHLTIVLTHFSNFETNSFSQGLESD